MHMATPSSCQAGRNPHRPASEAGLVLRACRCICGTCLCALLRTALGRGATPRAPQPCPNSGDSVLPPRLVGLRPTSGQGRASAPTRTGPAGSPRNPICRNDAHVITSLRMQLNPPCWRENPQVTTDRPSPCHGGSAPKQMLIHGLVWEINEEQPVAPHGAAQPFCGVPRARPDLVSCLLH